MTTEFEFISYEHLTKSVQSPLQLSKTSVKQNHLFVSIDPVGREQLGCIIIRSIFFLQRVFG